MVVHEIIREHKIRELCVVNGGPWGANRINAKFIEVLSTILDSDFINKFQRENPTEWFRFKVRFFLPKRVSTAVRIYNT